jgi:hypothetical protein
LSHPRSTFVSNAIVDITFQTWSTNSTKTEINQKNAEKDQKSKAANMVLNAGGEIVKTCEQCSNTDSPIRESLEPDSNVTCQRP